MVECFVYRYGNCFKTNIFGQTHVFISSTEATKKILSNEKGNFTKRYIKSIAKLVGDQSLLCASHQYHKSIRSQLSNLFSTTSLSTMVRQFDELTINNLSTWHKKSSIIILHEALKVGIPISLWFHVHFSLSFFQILFGHKLGLISPKNWWCSTPPPSPPPLQTKKKKRKKMASVFYLVQV